MKCILCGCTDTRACEGGCAWLIQDPPICDSHVVELVVDALRWRALVSTEYIADFSAATFSTCAFAINGRERGYAPPCGPCERPLMSNWKPRTASKGNFNQ